MKGVYHEEFLWVALGADRSGGQCCLVTVTLMYRTEGMKLCLSQIRMYKRMLQSILKIGLPAGFEAIMYSISNIIVQVSINNFGVDTMAAWTAYSKLILFSG